MHAGEKGIMGWLILSMWKTDQWYYMGADKLKSAITARIPTLVSVAEKLLSNDLMSITLRSKILLWDNMD